MNAEHGCMVSLSMTQRENDPNWKTWLIAALASLGLFVMVFGIANLRHGGNDAEAQCIRSIYDWKEALEAYKEKTGSYPADGTLRDAVGLALVVDELFPAPTKHRLHFRDPWGMEFCYQRVNKHRYRLGSFGMDRKIGKGGRKGKNLFGDGDDITVDNGRM